MSGPPARRGAFASRAAVCALLCGLLAGSSRAGGPRVFDAAGNPLRWTASPINYQVDLGRLGNLGNDQATALVQEAFATLQTVPTAALRFQMTGHLPVDVTEENWQRFYGVVGDGLSPIVFDADGRILDQLLGLTARNDFEGASHIDLASGTQILEASILINGACFDGISDARSPCELRSIDELRALLLHEAGHFVNLDHADLNRAYAGDGDASNNGVLPTMYPVQTEDDSTLATLNLDDVLALSNLYPGASFFSGGGSIEGQILASNGINAVNGANVVARNQEDPSVLAASAVSGDTGGPGHYRFAGLAPGNYTVEVAPIASAFSGRASVGRLAQGSAVARLPGPAEFLDDHESGDGRIDDPDARTVLSVQAGTALLGKNIILNSLASLADNQAGPDNNSCPTATRLTDGGDTVGDRILPGDVDFYRIYVPAGQTLRVDVDAADPGLGSTLRAKIGFFLPPGVLPSCQDVTVKAVPIPDPGTGGAIVDPAFDYVPTSSGDVIVAVTSVGDSFFTGAGQQTQGPYYLRVTTRAQAVTSLGQESSGGGVAAGGSGGSVIILSGGIAGTPAPNASSLDGSIVAQRPAPAPLPDSDGDGVADVSDPCPASPDADGDGVCDALDNCVSMANASQADGDGDRAGDACDAPVVLSVVPQDGSFNVPVAASVEVRFSEPMSIASFGAPSDPTAISLRGPGGVPVAATRAISPDGASVTLDPVAGLSPGTIYSVAVAPVITDRDTPPRSVNFAGATFTTAASTTRPVISVDRIGADVEGHGTSGASTGDHLGAALAAGGDLNGDGLSDLLVGAPNATGGAAGSGKVILTLGGPNAVAGGAPVVIEFAGANTGDEAGRSVAFVGDVNGDGYGDILIGAPGAAPSGTTAGAAYLVFGRADFATLPSPVNLATIAGPSCAVTGPCGVVLVGGAAGDRAGAAVAAAGDVNHDGRPDIVVGAPGRTVATGPADVRAGAGGAYLLFGGAALKNPGTVGLSDVGTLVPGVAFLGENAGDAAGSAVSGWRDRATDGIDDLLLGSPGADVLAPDGSTLPDAGIVHAIPGAAGMPSGTVDLRAIGQSIPGAALLGATAAARAGASVSGDHNVTGDAEVDALVGAPGLTFPGRTRAGAGILLPSQATTAGGPLKARAAGTFCLGTPPVSGPGPSPPAGTVLRTVAACSDAVAELQATFFMGEATDDQAGTSVRGVGDLNGDGLGDFAIGAPGADVSSPSGTLTDAGRVYLLLGESLRPAGYVGLEDVGVAVPGVLFDGRTASGRLGEAVAGGGDADGRFRTEILLGAPGAVAAPPDAGHSYVTAPYVTGEPANLGIIGAVVATLEWDRAPGAVRHRVYRGTVASLRTGGGVRTSAATCLTPGAVSDADADNDGRPDLVDATAPAAGAAFWYLVSGASALGEGSLGTDSSGRLRQNDGPCP